MNMEQGNFKKQQTNKQKYHERKISQFFCYHYIVNCHTKPLLLRTVNMMQLPKYKSDDKESKVSIVFAWKSSNLDPSE